MTENSTQTDLNSKWILLILVTGKPKGMADFRRSSIHWLTQHCSGTVFLCLCSAFSGVGYFRGLLKAAPGNPIPSLSWKQNHCTSPAPTSSPPHHHSGEQMSLSTGSHVFPKPVTTARAGNMTGLSQSGGPTLGAGGESFHPNHVAKYGKTGDHPKKRIYYLGEWENWRGVNRCLIIEHAVLCFASVILLLLLPCCPIH